MRPLQFALTVRSLNGPLKPALLLASELGAAGVQLDARNDLTGIDESSTGRRHFLHMLEEAGLKLASIDFPVRRGLCDPERLDARIESLKQTMEFAYQLKSRVVTIRLGDLPAESDQPGNSLVRTVLADVARISNRVGVTVAVNPGRESASSVVGLLREVADGLVAINFDPAASVSTGRPASEDLQTFGELVAHVVVRDAVRGADGMGAEVVLGRGEVPWEEVIALLHQFDYRGWLTADRTQGQDQAGDAARALTYLRSIALE
jgi:sugar phosphate isomerase/epimerase